MGKCESCERQKDRRMNANGRERKGGGERMRSHGWGKIIRHERENRYWCVYTDLGLSCFFYCVSSDASDRSKSARNRVEKFVRNSPQALDTGMREKERERERSIERELEMARRKTRERERE